MKDSKLIDILWVRASTDSQDIQAQLDELKTFAIADGAENIKIIGCAGASAIKLDDNYERMLDEVLSLARSGMVRRFYAWSLDRVGRNMLANFTIYEALTKAKVNMRIRQHNISTLDDDGNPNPSSSILFSVLSSVATQEMVAKKERFRLGRERSRREGRSVGGRMLKGYILDREHRPVIDPEGARYIRLAYELYATGDYSLSSLGVELHLRGFRRQGSSALGKTLRCTAYRGGEYNGMEYPTIIDAVLWDKVQDMLGCRSKKHASRRYFFALRLMRCPHCGLGVTYNNIGAYMCRRHVDHIGHTCDGFGTISIAQVDGLLYDIARRVLRGERLRGAVEQKRDLMASLEEARVKYEAAVERSEKGNGALERAKKLYIAGDLRDDEYAKTRERITRDMERERAMVSMMKERMDAVQEALDSVEGVGNNYMDKEYEWDRCCDPEVMESLVRRYIASCTPYGRDSEGYVALDIELFNGKKERWRMHSIGGRYRSWEVYEGKRWNKIPMKPLYRDEDDNVFSFKSWGLHRKRGDKVPMVLVLAEKYNTEAGLYSLVKSKK